jgi:antitoxin CptB
MESLKQLQWACRRGMLELDMLLMPFAASCYAKLSLEEQQNFQALLACDDTELLAWFTGTKPVKAEFAAMVKRIKDYAKSHLHSA